MRAGTPGVPSEELLEAIHERPYDLLNLRSRAVCVTTPHSHGTSTGSAQSRCCSSVFPMKRSSQRACRRLQAQCTP